jgi:2-polyprenyl-3-methyl-5-hydroxy-6-metoxy-1,4-benzoquinol methylase
MTPYNRLYEYLYNSVDRASQLSWHREEIPVFLKKIVALLDGKGNALDIGCGTGIYAAFMAQTGLQVTALDFVSRALDFARNRAYKLAVNINFIKADIVDWKSSRKYDLILDSGCLHSIKGQDRTRYKEQIISLLSPGGSYLLVHFGKKHFFNFEISGPIRKNPPEIERFFLPELKLQERYHEANKRGPMFHYWFNRA